MFVIKLIIQIFTFIWQNIGFMSDIRLGLPYGHMSYKRSWSFTIRPATILMVGMRSWIRHLTITMWLLGIDVVTSVRRCMLA